MNDLAISQPFINGLNNFPEKRKKEVAELRKWYDKHQHYPTISDEFLLLFLHACFYSVDKAKRNIEQYFNIRSNQSNLFGDRDLFENKIQNVLNYTFWAPLPEKSPKGYNVLLYGLTDFEASKFVFVDAVKTFFMYNDYRISEDGLAEGYIVLFDMKGVSVGHLARVTLPALRTLMNYVQEGHPARLKQIHILHTAAFINHVMKLIQPLIQNDMLGMIKFHNDLPPEDDVPLKILPRDFGGQAPPIADLYRQQRETMQSKRYTSWFLNSGKLTIDDAKKPKKKTFGGFFAGNEID